MIGNGLFFFVSGYTLFSSVQRSARSRNSTIYWFARRILRIYPTYWIYLIVSQCLESNGGGEISIIDLFVTRYWFLNTIIICYVLYFIVVRFLDINLIFVLTGIGLIPLLGCCNLRDTLIVEAEICFRWFFLFQIMLLGGWAASQRIKPYLVRDGVIMIGLLLAYYGYKALCQRAGIYWLQLLLPLLLIALVYFIYRVLYAVSLRCDFSAWSWRPVYALSRLTLEIYIVQLAIIVFFSRYVFPIGFLGAIVFIVCCAAMLHLITGWIVNPLLAYLQRRLSSGVQ